MRRLNEEGGMIKLVLIRDYSNPEKTTGTIMLPGFSKSITTLELPWRDNQRNISCIPEGTYEVERDLHGRHTWFKVNDVKDRSFIEIHEGYKPNHSAGCILLDLIELQDLMLYTSGEPFILEIKHA